MRPITVGWLIPPLWASSHRVTVAAHSTRCCVVPSRTGSTQAQVSPARGRGWSSARPAAVLARLRLDPLIAHWNADYADWADYAERPAEWSGVFAFRRSGGQADRRTGGQAEPKIEQPPKPEYSLPLPATWTGFETGPEEGAGQAHPPQPELPTFPKAS
jgi:hypothetical protein